MIWGQGMIWIKEVFKPTNFVSAERWEPPLPSIIYASRVCRITICFVQVLLNHAKMPKLHLKTIFSALQLATNDCTKLSWIQFDPRSSHTPTIASLDNWIFELECI